MAVYEANTYRTSIVSDSGNLAIVRLSWEGQLSNGDTVKLGVLPPFCEPVFFVADVEGAGSASLALKVAGVSLNVSDGAFTRISGVSPSEVGDTDIELVVSDANTATNFKIEVDFAYTVVQN